MYNGSPFEMYWKAGAFLLKAARNKLVNREHWEGNEQPSQKVDFYLDPPLWLFPNYDQKYLPW